jgi:hypothetical protein
VSRRAFRPTDGQRENVEALVGYGIPETEICRLVKNPETGKAIDAKTLRKHFPNEIATGAVKFKSLVANFIAATILGKPGGVKDERARVAAAIFVAKTRLGWSERMLLEHGGPGGGPILMQAAATLVLLPHNGRDPPRTPIEPKAELRDGET